MEETIEIRMLSSVAELSEAEWDACACPEAQDGGRPLDPFTTWRFLNALEQSGSVGTGTGWEPHYLAATVGGMLIGVAPLYAKGHSQGEYIFDHNWAHAYERAGGHYYPKLQIAVPFTPATGRRFLTHPNFTDSARSALMQGAMQIAEQSNLSGVHATFCTEDEVAAGKLLGLMGRKSQQYHWFNESYDSFDGFLQVLSSRKRKNIRKERERANAFGGDIHVLTGDQIEPEHWDSFWQFYQDTGARKWGTPYLTRAFFDIAHETLRDDIVLMLAERDGHYVAGALNFLGRDVIYGRYWGCIEDHPCLHFELCYYRAIDWAIEHGLSRVEAGAQGDHKLARGYMPTVTHSLHWLTDPGLRKAVAQFLAAEAAAVDEEIEILTDYGPFRKTQVEEQE
ncbi:GNAT family N-acetyltransferase [Donghicola sp.]|jgi:predicted N-acyltransferase|uniref:GNAT family N-acetyltransferase n=1 Tax=Donghicola sp. TaxID=1929294 RepID=UPI0025CFD73B|nr:GNAT family N-acetyltransferase [Donghicola sp.]MCT4576705.1 GNAT family N-acetyltransferase [Donghicola sp.]